MAKINVKDLDLKTGKEIQRLIDVVQNRKKLKKRTPFPSDFKANAAACWRTSGLSKKKFADTIGVSDSLIFNWDKQYPEGTTTSSPKVVATDTATKILLETAHGYIRDFEAGTRTDPATGESTLLCASTVLNILMEQEGDANTV